MPNPPGANPLVAERAPWRPSQFRVTGGQLPIGTPYRFLSFLLHTWQPLCDPNSHSWEGSFSYQGVSTRGVRHSPEFVEIHRQVEDGRSPRSNEFSGNYVTATQFGVELILKNSNMYTPAGNCYKIDSENIISCT